MLIKKGLAAALTAAITVSTILGNFGNIKKVKADGNDNWDSMYGQNYHVLNGEYEIVNGKVTRKR